MSNASDYADSITKDIHLRTDAEAPFGWRHKNTEEWSGDMPIGWLAEDEDEATEEQVEAAAEWEEASAMDYLSDALDFEYRVDHQRSYRSAKVMIAFGGPNAWIDTEREELRVTWGSSVVIRDLPFEFIEGIDEAMCELWETMTS